MTWLRNLPNTQLAFLVGLLLALGTAVPVITSAMQATAQRPAWEPSETWLLFIISLIGVPYATKRLTDSDHALAKRGIVPSSPTGPPAEVEA